ncbi:thioredoxin-like protein [Apiospora arundinis]|uniref:thioredoxin-dependent peroxiredoxin n=1 Tax=Apiospora arundinis TaxID=335852 RepID=A0ABR2J4B3_9PEZI
MPVIIRKRKTPPPSAPEPPAKKISKASENATKPVDGDVIATKPVDGDVIATKPVVGDVITLEGFGGDIETNDGTKTTLKALVDESKSGVVLFTYPKAGTPGCTNQACMFRDNYELFTTDGLDIYGLSSDSPKANTAFKEKQKLPYPLLCDPGSILINAIGLKKAPKGTTRGVFAVSKTGKVLLAEPGGPSATVEAVRNLISSNALNTMNNVANVVDSQGKYSEAEEMHRQTLSLKETVLGREHPDTLNSMSTGQQSAIDLVTVKPPPSVTTVIDSQIREKFRDPTRIYTSKFAIAWELRRCISEDLDSSCDLGLTLTISGDQSHSWVVSCRDYVETMWTGGTASSFLAKLEGALGKSNSTDVIDHEEDGLHIILASPDQESLIGSTIVSYTGTVTEISHIAQFLAWIAATFRMPKPDQLSCSSVKFSSAKEYKLSDSEGDFALHLLPLYSLPRDEPGTCWAALFPTSIMAFDFPVLEAHGTSGLRIPVDAMLELAEILHDVSLKNDDGTDAGVYFDGPLWRLYPTGYIPGSKTVQWHLVKNSIGHQHAWAPDHEGGPQWLRAMDLETLKTSNAILGYCNEVQIRLGTVSRIQHYGQYRHARAMFEKPRPEASLGSISVGANAAGRAIGTMTAAFRTRKGHRVSLNKTKEINYNDILNHASKAPVILFDTQKGKERAWMVPQLSLILDLYNFWAHCRQVRDIRYAALGPDGGSNAKAVLEDQDYSRMNVGREILVNDREVSVGTKIKTIYSRIQKFMEKNQEDESGASGTVNTGHTQLPGWDWLELIEDGGHISLRRNARPSSCPKPSWLQFTTIVPVFLGQNMGDLITPTRPEQVCRHWHPLPGGFESNYMASSVRCLEVLSSTYGSGSSRYCEFWNNLTWEFRDTTLFEPCITCAQTDSPTLCRKLPQKVSFLRNKLQKPPPNGYMTFAIPLDGAVVFGAERKGVRDLHHTQGHENGNDTGREDGDAPAQIPAEVPRHVVDGTPEQEEVPNRAHNMIPYQNGGNQLEVEAGGTPNRENAEVRDQEALGALAMNEGDLRDWEIDEAQVGNQNEVADRDNRSIIVQENGGLQVQGDGEGDEFFDALED